MADGAREPIRSSAAPGAPRLMTPTVRAFDAWFAVTEPGARCTYWSGLLAVDCEEVGGIADAERRRDLRALAAHVRQMAQWGHVRLYQARTPIGTFNYIAEKPRAPKVDEAAGARLPAGAAAGSSAGRSSNGRK